MLQPNNDIPDMVPAADAPIAPTTTNAEVGSKVIAFVTDDASTSALRVGLLSLGEDLDLRRGNLRHAVRYFERESNTRAAIVDISGIDDPVEALSDLSRVCPAAVKVVVVGENADIGFYRMLVNDLAVAEYLYKPLNRNTVQRLVLPLLSGAVVGPEGARGGHVVAVCGAHGGAGATTVAVSAALELVAATRGHVALLDLHLRDGAAALMLSRRPGPGLRIALEDPGRVDALFLDRTAIPIDDRLKLIAAEEAYDSSPMATSAGVAQLLDLLRQRFNYIIVDLPMPPQPAMQRVLDLARNVVVVLEPDIASLRDAVAIHNLVINTTGTDRVVMILNRADTEGGLSRSLIRAGLGREPDICIPDLGRRMIQALNLGEPAVRRGPALRNHLAPLIREIAGIGGRRPRSWLERMLRA